ncbi:MAG: hypothetical protein KJ574_00585 [Nanoarchaeota archaeon]|nr:hypothetical protein [Nanoarchaeota archaeon]
MTKKLAGALKIGEFIPVMKPSYADFDEVMRAHGGKTFADIKYDGYRIQIHKNNRRFWMFTGDGNEYNYRCYPEIVEIVEKLPTCIIEAELIGEGNNHKQVFDKVKRRFRRPGIKQKTIDAYLESGIINDIPLSLRVFDTLRFEKKGLLYVPLEERRKYTERFDGKGMQPTETQLVTGTEELEALIEQTFKAKQEGRVCKNPASLYHPGQTTGIDWIKFKRSEPLDLVIVGFYTNENYANGLPFTSVLCATYNDEKGVYETIGKIGVTRAGLANEIHREVATKICPTRPRNVAFSEKLERQSFAKYVPQSYIYPEQSIVLEVKAMNLNLANNWQTCGYENGKAFSMRIGFAQQVRYDKSPKMATKTCAVRKLYELQNKSNKEGETC